MPAAAPTAGRVLLAGGVECIDLGSGFGRKGGVLFDGVWVESIDPEHGIVETIADAVGILHRAGNPA
jgi:hypothetical protein